MKCYQVSHYYNYSDHAGYTYHSTKAEAEKALRAAQKAADSDLWPDIKVVEWEHTRAGVITLLNDVADHPDNG